MASYSFNLVDESWIPCLMLDGTASDLGLLETLTRAHETREVFDPSPLITVALHRLLLAILHRNFGPADLAEWAHLWNENQWDRNRLSMYFSSWRQRFDLFDDQRPFYQTGEIANAKRHPAHLLAIELSSGNNQVLFDHSNDFNPLALSPAAAARYLVARQAYSIGLGNSSPFHFSDSPLIRGLSTMALGGNLFETLALNLIAYGEDRPFPRRGDDLPAWEQENPAQPQREGSPISGYLDYLTWQSRSIHLFPEGDPVRVCYCQLQQNLKLPKQEYLGLDPFKRFMKDPQHGYVPLSISKNKAPWRDSDVLFQKTDLSHIRPVVFDWLANIEDMRRNGRIEAKKAYGFVASGLATRKGKAASVILWRHERMPLPLDYLLDESLVGDLHSALAKCEAAGKALGSALWKFAATVLAPHEGKAERNAVRDLVSHLGADRFFWSRLETPFYRLLSTLPNNRERTLDEWITTLRRTAWDAFDDATHGLDQSARTLKALVKARGTLGATLKQALEENE